MVKREADDASVIAAEDTCSAGLRDQLASHRLVLPGDRFRDAALAAPARSRSTPTVGVLRKLGRPMALALLDLHRTQPRRRGRAPFTVDQGAVLSHEPATRDQERRDALRHLQSICADGATAAQKQQ